MPGRGLNQNNSGNVAYDLRPSTARSMMVGRVFLVLTGACQFGHGVGGFTTSFIHSFNSGNVAFL